MNPNKTYTQNDQLDDADEGSNECNTQRSQEKFPQSQPTSKRSESSHKSQSRPNSKAATMSQQLRSRSNLRTNKSWISTNPFVNFMYEFRKSQSGQKSANVFRLGGEQWRHMSETDKRPFIEAADQNKKLKHQERKPDQKQSSNDQEHNKTRATKSKAPNKSSSSKKPLIPKKRKVKVTRKGTQKRQEAELKKRRAQNDTDSDTDTSGSIHNATTDCPSEDSDNS